MSNETTTGQDMMKKKKWMPPSAVETRSKRLRQTAVKRAFRANGGNRPMLKPISEHRLKAIHAICAQIANDQKFEEETVRRFTSAWFGVHDIAELHHLQYREAIKFLADLRLDWAIFPAR